MDLFKKRYIMYYTSEGKTWSTNKAFWFWEDFNHCYNKLAWEIFRATQGNYELTSISRV